mmetsp:Transcript_12000/g.42070  ORF Transcript_12000/g.42070 Transcript_12000/m.42070 type:complete len:216 (+) Transcript_12000:332-979(+)
MAWAPARCWSRNRRIRVASTCAWTSSPSTARSPPTSSCQTSPSACAARRTPTGSAAPRCRGRRMRQATLPAATLASAMEFTTTTTRYTTRCSPAASRSTCTRTRARSGTTMPPTTSRKPAPAGPSQRAATAPTPAARQCTLRFGQRTPTETVRVTAARLTATTTASSTRRTAARSRPTRRRTATAAIFSACRATALLCRRRCSPPAPRRRPACTR